MKDYTCEMIRDLIPLCTEGLCSEESRKAVEAHIASCEQCRRLYEQPPADAAPEAVPDEGAAMKKVNRKMKRSKVKVVLLSIAAAALALVLVVLSVGQVVKHGSIPSFETVGQTINVYPVVRMLTRGDYEGFMQHASNGSISTVWESKYIQLEAEQDTQLLSEAYEETFGSTTVKHILVHSEYTPYDTKKAASKPVISYAKIFYADGRSLDLEIYRDMDGLYRCEATGLGYTEEDMEGFAGQKLVRALHFIATHKVQSGWVMEVCMTKPVPESDDPDATDRLERRCELMTRNRFTPDCADRIAKQCRAFFEKGYIVQNCDLSEVHYDEETRTLYYRLYVTASDGDGTAALCAKLPFTYEGLHAQSEVSVYRSGCGDALAKDLENLFS